MGEKSVPPCPFTPDEIARAKRRKAKALVRQAFRSERQPGLKAPIRQWHATHRQITSQQRELVQKLEEAQKALRRTYHGPRKTIDKERLRADDRRYERLIHQMIRCGLDDHPLVIERQPFLHYPGRGRPFKRPSEDDYALIRAVKPLLARGLSLSAVHRQLQEMHAYEASRQALDKRLRRLSLWPFRR
jgi:hypothetical protein